MFYIEELKKDSLVLEKDKFFNYKLTIISVSDNGKSSPFAIDVVSSPYITAYISEGNILVINADTPNIKGEEFVILRNTNKESIRLTIIPNNYYTMDKVFKFKITNYSELDDGSIKIKIFSKVNDIELGWKCIYDGKPMTYVITPMKSDKGTHVTITPNATIVNEFTSVIIFKQDESDKEIRFEILNTPNGIHKKG